MQKNKHRPLLTLGAKVKPKWIKDRDIIPKAIKYLKENVGKTYHDFEVEGILKYRTRVEIKINKWHCTKLRSCSTSKKMIRIQR